MKQGLKKALAMLLSVAMAFTFMAMPVYADDLTEAGTDEVISESHEAEAAPHAEDENHIAGSGAVVQEILHVVEASVQEEAPDAGEPAQEGASERASEGTTGSDESAVSAEPEEESAVITAEAPDTENAEKELTDEAAAAEITEVKTEAAVSYAAKERAASGTERSQAIAAADSMTNDITEAEPVSEITYTGSDFKFVKADLTSTFGMLTPKSEPEPSILLTEGGKKIKFSFTPGNLATYAGFYIEADTKIPSTWDENKFIAVKDDGTYEFELDASYCGKAWPVAPVKKSDRTATTGSQYYLAIPPAELIEEEGGYTIDDVKVLIEDLPNCADVTEADRERIEIAQTGYEALSEEDQAQLDSETCPGKGQPYGRILESALWGLWSLSGVDNTTTLDPGTYDDATTPALESSYSKGKSTSGRQRRWSVKSITVDEEHKVTAILTVESSSYSGIIYQGKTFARTNTSGNSEFEPIPIDLNTTFYFSGVSTSMPDPIAFSVTTEIDESPEGPEPEADADYSKVDAALAKVPKDLGVYTDESVKALNKAINAVVRGLKASEQAKADAMAKAIENAVRDLKKKEVIPDGSTALKIINNTGMFKVESAYLHIKDGKESMVITMSGSGYHELYKGTYEQAVANGDGSRDKGNNSWTHGRLTSEGKWEFKLPLKPGESYVPCIAISNTYYQKYLNGENPLGRAFFSRQFEVDRKAKTLVTGDYNEAVDFKITSKVADFKVNSIASANVVGGPNSNNYSISPVLVMQDDTYDEIIYPTVKDGKLTEEKASAKNGKFTVDLSNMPGIEAFRDKKPIEMKFHVSADAPYKAAGEYVKRTVTINMLAGTIVINGTPLAKKGSSRKDDIIDPDAPIIPEDKEDDSNNEDPGYAPAVDTSTILKDGIYTPDSFSWSGGSGRLAYIRCNKITVRNGQAYAEIEFSSPNYDALKASGGTYTKQGAGNSVFVIPVNLNANNSIVGRTTAMSQTRWVTYTVYIGLTETSEEGQKAKKAKEEAADAKIEISKEAPTIMGLEAAENEEEAVEYSRHFRIFNYENGVKMLSIDISGDTALKEEYTENAKKAAETGTSGDDLEYDDEEGKVISRSKGEYIEEMYRNNVVNYLLVPEDYEIPAGLDKEYIIITVPCEKSFVASQEALEMMEKLNCTDALSLLGIDEKEIKSKELKKALKDEKIKPAGNNDKIEFAEVVREKTDLAILSGDLLPEEIKKDADNKEKLEKEAKEKQEILEKYESRFTALGVPVVIDRSAQEEDELAQAEWIKVYGTLFGCDELAKKIFDEKVEEAERNGKN